ncbi:sensor domain-containing diguanylate cyclase [Halomonas pacifica]|uniref:sensor domain-containing diguanylate cyclase n=1 Tax=Bisbaumannia pacifica TaxID=77098 RepID=UPI0023599797|nr:sensor domain-containing diguanylate cyclase [Halomonas pacifica]MDC8803023.1 sensor domain-containing diguanylate cyclase [Halomonas pacifica]
MPLTLLPQDNLPRIIHAAPIGICITNAEGRFEMVNPAYCDFYGYAEEELLGRHFTQVVPEAERARLTEQHRAFIHGEADQECREEHEVRCKNGERRTILAEASRLVDAQGEVKKVTYVVDITRQNALQRRLAFLASHDELTGLLNRRAGMSRLDEEIRRGQRYGTLLSVAIIDLDHFKRINDRHGHAVGDEVLCETAALMRQELRASDALVRLGGEEFLVILPGVDRPRALEAIERLRRLIELTPMGQPGLALTLSAGVANWQAEESSHLLLERADKVLYRAKARGRNLALMT